MSVFGLANNPTLSLTPTSTSFPFPSKYIYLNNTSSTPKKVTLGSTNPAQNSKLDSSETARTSAASNGYFKDNNGVWPMSLEWDHAEAWFENGLVWIAAKSTKHGTFVNDELLPPDRARPLKLGDIVTLGDNISPPEGVAATDVQLRPINAKVGLLGVPNTNW